MSEKHNKLLRGQSLIFLEELINTHHFIEIRNISVELIGTKRKIEVVCLDLKGRRGVETQILKMEITII